MIYLKFGSRNCLVTIMQCAAATEQKGSSPRWVSVSTSNKMQHKAYSHCAALTFSDS
jgi:hypothetical protein